MKSDRRHELQKNDLASGINDLPTLLRLHSNKILVAVIIVCVIVMLLRYRANSAAQASLRARGALNSARTALMQLRMGEQMGGGEPAARAKQQRDLAGSINATIDTVFDDASGAGDSIIRAEALVTRGDLNWTLANLHPLPGAATRPELSLPKPSTDYLDAAEQAYRQVIGSYPDAALSRATAILGLAAIAENRRDWKAAAEQYSKLTADASVDKTFKDLARQRLALLPQIEAPIFIGSFSSTQPTTAETTQPATTGPTTVNLAQPPSTTLPATHP